MEGENEWLVVSEYGEISGFHHVSEMLHYLVNCQQLPVVCAVNLLRRAQFPGEEGDWLSYVLRSLLEDGTHGVVGGVCHQSESRC
jgi:hypothetical protein